MKSNAENIYSLKGFEKVFRFTLAQTFKNKAYISSFIIFVLLMTFMGPTQYLSSGTGAGIAEQLSGTNIEDPNTENLIIINEASGKVELQEDAFDIASIGLTDTKLEVHSKGENADAIIAGLGKSDLLILINNTAGQYLISGIKSDDSEIDNNELEDITSYITDIFENKRIESNSISQDDIVTLQKGVYNESSITEEEYVAAQNETVTTSALLNYVMAFTILIMIVSTMSASYIIASVTEEKTSKLVESLLVSVRPMALLLGKVFGMMAYIMSVLVCGFLGASISQYVMIHYFGADKQALAGMIDFGFITRFGALGAVIMILSIIISYAFFGGLSGIFGAACTKTEDIQSASGTVMMIVMAGYIGAVMGAGFDNEIANHVLSIIPPFSMYTSSIYYLTGRVSTGYFALSLLIQIVIAIGIYLLGAHTYRKLILSDSSTPKLKDIILSLKN